MSVNHNMRAGHKAQSRHFFHLRLINANILIVEWLHLHQCFLAVYRDASGNFSLYPVRSGNHARNRRQRKYCPPIMISFFAFLIPPSILMNVFCIHLYAYTLSSMKGYCNTCYAYLGHGFSMNCRSVYVYKNFL